MNLLIFCLIPATVNSIGEYNGYFFQDNLLQGSLLTFIIWVSFTDILFREIWSRKWLCYVQHRNTHSELCKLKTFLSLIIINISQVSVCFKVFADFIRFGGQVGAVEIIRLNEPQPSMSLLCMYYCLQYYSIFFPFLSKSGTIELFILTDCEPWRQIKPIRS